VGVNKAQNTSRNDSRRLALGFKRFPSLALNAVPSFSERRQRRFIALGDAGPGFKRVSGQIGSPIVRCLPPVNVGERTTSMCVSTGRTAESVAEQRIYYRDEVEVDSQLTTATLPGKFAGSSAIDVIEDWACSGMTRYSCDQLSTTCSRGRGEH
jgi:hypothetical protein